MVPALLSTQLARTLFISKQAVGSFLSVATELLTLPPPDGLLPEEHSSRTCLEKMARPQSHFFVISQASQQTHHHSCREMVLNGRKPPPQGRDELQEYAWQEKQTKTRMASN